MPPASPRSILLDTTRLVSRVGAGPLTGIDRVEKALLSGLLAREVLLHGLCRTAFGFALLPRSGLEALLRRIDGMEPWGPPDLAGRLSLRLPPARRAAEGDMRRLASAVARASGLSSLLRGRLAPGTVYLNVGHANLSGNVFEAVRCVPSARAAVMIHDVIPLRLPWTQRPGAAARFGQKLAVAQRHADLLMCPSAAEASHVQAALAQRDRVPPIIVIPPGIDRVAPAPGFPRPRTPYFVAVGTLEPRKNIALLLDVWDRLASVRPQGSLPGLVLIGRRGWEEPRFFRRLDAIKSRLPEVEEHSALSDEARAALVAGARALLFPSLAEGYGLPPLEALSLGVVPVCAALPVYRETMGEAAVYANATDMYQWAGIVGDLAASMRTSPAESGWKPPAWDSFVDAVLSACAQVRDSPGTGGNIEQGLEHIRLLPDAS
jgi:glycosyltransferase involved in cell wall biosynthesis